MKNKQLKKITTKRTKNSNEQITNNEYISTEEIRQKFKLNKAEYINLCKLFNISLSATHVSKKHFNIIVEYFEKIKKAKKERVRREKEMIEKNPYIFD